MTDTAPAAPPPPERQPYVEDDAELAEFQNEQDRILSIINEVAGDE